MRTRYLHAGDKANPSFIFLHGVGGHAEAYARNLDAQSKHFLVWSVDMLGHGWTDKATSGLEIPNYVNHIVAFMKAIAVERAHFSGESLGGWVASRMAADHPERVDHLVLNTAGGSQADPVEMKRLKTLSMKAATEPP